MGGDDPYVVGDVELVERGRRVLDDGPVGPRAHHQRHQWILHRPSLPAHRRPRLDQGSGADRLTGATRRARTLMVGPTGAAGPTRARDRHGGDGAAPNLMRADAAVRRPDPSRVSTRDGRANVIGADAPEGQGAAVTAGAGAGAAPGGGGGAPVTGGAATPMVAKARSTYCRMRSVLEGVLPLTMTAHVMPSGRRMTIERAFSTVPVCPHVPSAQTRRPSPYHWPSW